MPEYEYELKDFQSLFTKQMLKDSARRLYSCYINNYNSFAFEFEKCFSIPYSFIFNGLSYEDFLYNLLKNNYRNELFVKKRFEQLFFASSPYIEELPILNSRIDIASVGDFSFAYEIKTKYDTLQRLEKQINDYSKCFEMVYVICSEDKYDEVLGIIPKHCGIFTYKDRANCIFKERRKAFKSNSVDPLSQLMFMHSNELKKAFDLVDYKKIQENADASIINQKFKETLRYRISKKSA